METDQSEQLGTLLTQSAKVLNKSQEAEERDASTTPKNPRKIMSPPS